MFSKRKYLTNSSGLIHLVLLIVVFVIAAIGLYFVFISKNTLNINDLAGRLAKSPIDQFKSAMEKTADVDTLYADYTMDVVTKITFIKQGGLTEENEARVSGYITGSTDGKTTKMELKIANPANPQLSLVISIITTDDGNIIYLKGPATEGKWWKYTKEKFEAESATTPTDASVYGFNILGTLFSESKALLKTIQEDSITKLSDHTQDGKKYSNFKVDINVPSFISSIDSDEEYTDKDISDARIILSDAIVNAMITVDQSTNYVTEMEIEGKHLKNVPTDESANLGVEATYDFSMKVNFSRFEVPTGVTPPAGPEVIEK